ncbi:MAG: alginate export family protein [Methylococcaceae bacterium]|nr:alginate export family protein [Methylococcaceae bacterium]
MLTTKPVMALLLSGYATLAIADITLYQNDDLTLSASISSALGAYFSGNTRFGAGRLDFFSGENTGDAHWAEGYLKPGLFADYTLAQAGRFFGGVSSVTTFTVGDGDAGGYTKADEDAALEQLYVGWDTKSLLKDTWGIDALSLSYGRQTLQIGDGLMVWDGNFDMYSKASYWLAPRTAFPRAGLVRMDVGDTHVDGFYLKTDFTWEETAVIGLNLEQNNFLSGKLGFLYVHVLDSTFGAFQSVRDQMNVYSLNFTELSPPGLDNLDFWGNAIYEHGEGKQGAIDAFGWYLEGRYGFADWPWQPSLTYRYVQFSGDDQPDDDTSTSFNALYYGYSRGWGSWYQGEIVGAYYLFNSNMKTQMLKATVTPTDTLTFGAIYYQFNLDANNYYGVHVNNRRFADEFDLYADLTLTDHITMSAAYAVAVPDEGGKQAFGGNQTEQLFEIILYVNF